MKFLELSNPEVPIIFLWVDDKSEKAFAEQGTNLRKLASDVASHLRSLASTTRLPNASLHHISPHPSSCLPISAIELGWRGKGFKQQQSLPRKVLSEHARYMLKNKRFILHPLRHLKIGEEDRLVDNT